MADLSKIKINNTTYNLKDAWARDNFDNYYTDVEVDDMFDNFELQNMISTTWANLVNLRDNNELVPGSYYRIIDYNFVCSKLNVQSGNHQFDIIVLAVSESMLSENAYAAKHAGDTYFQREITIDGIEWLYTIYADDFAEDYGGSATDHSDDIHSDDIFCDSGVMEHPVTGDEVPILYKTDAAEYDTDDPDYEDIFFYEGTYNLDGDDYDMWSKYEMDENTGNYAFAHQYALTPLVVEDGELTTSPTPSTTIIPVNINAWQLKYCLDNDKSLYDWADTNGKGVIYYMKDEFGNEAPYDFKNVKFLRKQISTVNNTVVNQFVNLYYGQSALSEMYTCNNNSRYYYTFIDSDDYLKDGSITGTCTYNTILPALDLDDTSKKVLNDIVIQTAVENYFGVNCRNITIMQACRNNTFKQADSILIMGSSYNIMENCRLNMFQQLQQSEFVQGASYNYGKGCSQLILKNMCQHNVFNNACTAIVCGYGCMNNNFGTYCYYLTLGNSVASCTFGQYCQYGILDGNSTNIQMSNYYRYFHLGLQLTNVSINTSGGGNTNYVQYITVANGVRNKTITPQRNTNYEQYYYGSGRIENAI